MSNQFFRLHEAYSLCSATWGRMVEANMVNLIPQIEMMTVFGAPVGEILFSIEVNCVVDLPFVANLVKVLIGCASTCWVEKFFQFDEKISINHFCSWKGVVFFHDDDTDVEIRIEDDVLVYMGKEGLQMRYIQEFTTDEHSAAMYFMNPSGSVEAE